MLKLKSQRTEFQVPSSGIPQLLECPAKGSVVGPSDGRSMVVGSLAGVKSEYGCKLIAKSLSKLPGFQASTWKHSRLEALVRKTMLGMYDDPRDDHLNQLAIIQVVIEAPEFGDREFPPVRDPVQRVYPPFATRVEAIDEKLAPQFGAKDLLLRERSDTHIVRSYVTRLLGSKAPEILPPVSANETRWFIGGSDDLARSCVTERGVGPRVEALASRSRPDAPSPTRAPIIAFAKFSCCGQDFTQSAFSVDAGPKPRILDWREAKGSADYFFQADAGCNAMWRTAQL